jgi:pimeloyl-ACP methyl ester carboxylesterase
MVEPSLALCDQGEIQWFPEATHWLQHEEPDQVSQALIELFQRGPK